MSMMGIMSKPTRRLLTQAVEDEAFRTKFFNNRKSIFDERGIPDSETAILEKELFAGVKTEKDFHEKLIGIAGMGWSG